MAAKVRVTLPEEFNQHSVFELALHLEEILNEKWVSIDFSNVNFTTPLGSLIVGRHLRYFISHRKTKSVRTSVSGVDYSNPAHSYLNFIGFMDFLGVPNQTKMGFAKGSLNYVPIQVWTRRELLNSAGLLSTIHDASLKLSIRLANVLVGENAENEENISIVYSLKEVIRNSFEHSESDYCILTAQRWKDGRVEIAVIDEGVGIRLSLSRAMKFVDDESALKAALKPGVSSTMRMPNSRNVNNNSGYGLYILSELGRKYGKFSVGSGNSSIESGTKGVTTQPSRFQGTFVGLRIEKPLASFEEILANLIEIGEESAKIEGGRPIASRTSRGVNSNHVE